MCGTGKLNLFALSLPANLPEKRQRRVPSLSFFAVTLIPAALLAAGSLLGGWWAGLALIAMTAANQLADAAFDQMTEGRAGNWVGTALPILLAVLHFALLPLSIWAIALSDHDYATRIALFLAFGFYFGSVSNAVGHELIHRTSRVQFQVGKWIFISHLFGHHTSAHRLIHHPYVATRFDPNTARFNENFYRFFARAWKGSFRAGLAAENARRGLPDNSRAVGFDNPYFLYICGAALFLGIAAGFGGIPGLITYLGLAIMAQGGLLLTDYVQHYGLSRQQDANGRFEPVGALHSWNAPHWFTRNLTLNAPLHSHHHARPAHRFTELVMDTDAPQLPYSPGLMAVIALNPARWRRVMNPRVAQAELMRRKENSSPVAVA